MKAQFKYAFISCLYIRGLTFAVVFVLCIAFIAIGSSGSLPFAAHVTFLSLGGLAAAAMLAANLASDVIAVRRMFASADAYLQALTPTPRSQTLLANIIVMMIMDILTMAFVIISITWMSFNFIGGNIGTIFWETVFSDSSHVFYAILLIAAIKAGYLLLLMIILFCVSMKKSVFYKLPASGFLAFLLACGCFYAVNLLQLVLLPISSVEFYGLYIILTPGSMAAYPLLIMLTFLEAAALFVVTSRLLERKINI